MSKSRKDIALVYQLLLLIRLVNQLMQQFKSILGFNESGLAEGQLAQAIL